MNEKPCIYTIADVMFHNFAPKYLEQTGNITLYHLLINIFESHLCSYNLIVGGFLHASLLQGATPCDAVRFLNICLWKWNHIPLVYVYGEKLPN